MKLFTDKKEFIEVLKENKKILYKVLYAYCQNPEDRKDLEQEIIIQLWKSMKSYNGTAKLSTWIYRVAMNVAISYYRNDLKRSSGLSPIEEHVFYLADEESSTELLDERKQHLRRFINQLDELNKAIMVLYLEDCSYQEISEIVGISPSNVGTKINRIKIKLKEYFTQISNSI